MLFLQVLANNKFLGYLLTVIFLISKIALTQLHFDHHLYDFGSAPEAKYSDMNGYGHFVPSIVWATSYWFAIFALLGIVSMAYARRGAEDSLRARSRQAQARMPALAAAATVCALSVAAVGAWYYYNAHVLNEYTTAEDRRRRLADYEKQFKKYEHLPQPKVLSVDAQIEIFPDRRSFSGTGRFLLENKTSQPIAQIHITNSQQSVNNVSFDRPFHIVSASPRNLYAIYALEKPLAPGETMNI